MESIWKLEMEITGFNAVKEKEIIRACTVEWVFGEEDFDSGRSIPDGPLVLWATGTGTLYDGESKDELIERLILAIVRANGGSCFVKVEATCLRKVEPEFDPLEEHELAMG